MTSPNKISRPLNASYFPVARLMWTYPDPYDNTATNVCPTNMRIRPNRSRPQASVRTKDGRQDPVSGPFSEPLGYAKTR